MTIQTDSFLGANTPRGFVSLFSELYDPYGDWNAVIIKGGPGCGKSTLMKRAAEAAAARGFSVERVHCGSDPQSLDAVLVPEKRFCICDGTAPHVLEPKFPGVCETLLDLGAFWDKEILREKAEEIRRLTVENALFHRRAARHLAAAGHLTEDLQSKTERAILEEKLHSYAVRFCARELPRQKTTQPGKRSRRYLSGITPEGRILFESTLHALSSRVIALEDPYTAAAGMLLEEIGSRALAKGFDVIFCLDPMQPDGCCEGLILPQASLSLIRVRAASDLQKAPARTIHIRRFLRPDAIESCLRYLKLQQKLTDALIEESVDLLRQAKQTHDKLERCYGAAMDFSALEQFAAAQIERWFEG